MLKSKDSSSSQGTTDIKAVKRKIGETEFTEAAFPVLHSPASHATGRSVLVGAQVTRKWLETVISPLPSKPSAELERMLGIHDDKSILDEVMTRANVVLSALFPKRQTVSSLQDVNLMESMWSEQRRSEALKLYYRVLESVCQSEAGKSNTSDHLSGLLSNERFHRCLLACSAELVSAAQTGTGMLLSVIFERTGVTAFDLSKVIESFIIHEPTLPRELRRHLNSMEEQLLERRVWEKGSSLYNSLVVARPALSDEINSLQLLAQPMPSLETVSPTYFGGLLCSTILQKHKLSQAQDRGTISPKRPCTEHADVVLKHNSTYCPKTDCPTAFSTPQTKQTSASPSSSLQNMFTSPTCSDTAINVLFSKMAKLGAIRTQSIAERLKLSKQFREKVYFLFQQILNQRTTLFFNRHMDQIVLCCFYGLAKMSGVNLTFKQIYDNYMKQPQCRSQIFWSVSGNHERNGGQYAEMITFYNRIFLPSVKSFLEEIHHREPPTQVPDIKNIDSAFPSLPDISPKKVSPSHNVYLSPVRLSKDDLNSNMTKSYYAFVGESIYPYETPSKQLSDINERLNRTKKVKRRLNFDNEGVAVISDDVVLNSLFPQNNKCGTS
ncbi:retinoblastoma-related protein-like [Ricinus communis]|uniref:retinoblastoma-related protein-like n=1 Tax=Ricinus communis TaxID=3988 RepID=UPI00201B0109|nr:retinoblastoma-related protein-like [Ricinus communis]